MIRDTLMMKPGLISFNLCETDVMSEKRFMSESPEWVIATLTCQLRKSGLHSRPYVGIHIRHGDKQ